MAGAWAPPFAPGAAPGGCDGGCVGGIIGGCFVPVLLCILWLGGAFGDKCPSPLKSKKPEGDSGGVTMTSIEKAEEKA